MKKKIEILVLACLASLLMMTSCWLDYEYDPDPVDPVIINPSAYKDTIYYTEGDNFLDVIIDTVNYLSLSTVDTVKFFMSYEFATDTINGKPVWKDYPQDKILQQNKNKIRIEKIPNFDDDSVRFKIYAISYDNGLASYVSAKLINFSEISSGNLLKLNPRYINDTIMVSLDSVLNFPEDKTFDLFIRGHFVYLHGSLLYYNDNTYENKDVFFVDHYGVDGISNDKLVFFVYLEGYNDVFSLKGITIKNKIIYFPPNPQIVGRNGNNIFVLIPKSTQFLELKIIN